MIHLYAVLALLLVVTGCAGDSAIPTPTPAQQVTDETVSQAIIDKRGCEWILEGSCLRGSHPDDRLTLAGC